MDRLSPQQRHNNMAAIRSKDTRPEMVVRKWLWSHGFRYRLNTVNRIIEYKILYFVLKISQTVVISVKKLRNIEI